MLVAGEIVAQGAVEPVERMRRVGGSKQVEDAKASGEDVGHMVGLVLRRE